MANGEEEENSELAGLLRDGAKQLIPVLLTGTALIGFVALAGGAVLWSRFYAIHVPPEQVVSVVPKGEAVAVGSMILLLLGLFGALATLTVYLVDRGGRATPGMSRALLLILTSEAAVAIWITDSAVGVKVIASEVLAIVFGVALWSTFVGGLIELKKELPDRECGEESQPLEETTYWREGNEFKVKRRSVEIAAAAAALLGVIAFLLSALFGASMSWRWIIALGAVGAALTVAVTYPWVLFTREIGPGEDPKGKPPLFRLTLYGDSVMVALAIAAVLVPSLIVGKPWLAISLGALFVIGAGLWRIAGLSGKRFVGLGLAVFISVPLFGALMLMVRNLFEPQVQAMALIRSTDGPNEAIQGIFVAETDDRVYFANVATEGCNGEVSPGSGRLLWVPKKEVVAMSIGPLQDLNDAGKSALEMAYALTPSVETPTAGAVSLTAPEKQTEKVEEAEETRRAKEAEAHAPGLDQRLQDPGPAVRPNFGAGLSLVPEIASPGKVVELRLSVPNPAVNGFGSRPQGRVLRLNGAPISPLREETTDADQAEYAKTEGGALLSLDKRGEYGVNDGRPYALDGGENYRGPRYVKIDDSMDVKVTPAPFDGGAHYLEIEEDDEGLADGQKVSVEGGKPESVQAALLRQAWSNDLIRFRVPDNASSGVVTVECEQLAGSPLLRVAHAPTARITARMQQNSLGVSLDSSRSSDADGERISRRWTIEGLGHGHRERISTRLLPGFRPYAVKLTTTDEAGNSDSATLRLMRLPTAMFGFDGREPKSPTRIERAAVALERSVRARPPTAIELDGNTDHPGSLAYNMRLSIERDERVGKLLLKEAEKPPPDGKEIPVREVGFGETCPVDPYPGRRVRNRRVDVFVLEEGVSVKPPKGCLPGKFKNLVWHPPKPPARKNSGNSTETGSK